MAARLLQDAAVSILVPLLLSELVSAGLCFQTADWWVRPSLSACSLHLLFLLLPLPGLEKGRGERGNVVGQRVLSYNTVWQSVAPH